VTTILLAEDHQIVREALRLLLETQTDFSIIAEAGDGLEALQLTEKYKPDTLIVDLMMPGLSGLEVARRTRRLSPSTKVIVLSMHDAESYVVEALGAGVAGYVLKRSSAQELVFAIRQAQAGDLYLSPSLNKRAIQAYIQLAQESQSEDLHELLTPREREVFHLAVEGLTNPQIAGRLSLSVRTVEMHRGNLMKKLGVNTQTELVKYAVKRGLVE
jgi:DNA-binding NarL/FixJ family response regulator